ncbi:extracellular solute-binding protein [Saliterribacillus persicus]|uniref:Putative aldouronate transport system substrate-binding protein n=1 Tax=Saliterribacillus persicus TaxID=930114 RepID=A0A368X8J1_9BACI|nr:extracellular solute-binding protein [Saliterribacillus persicus]RCW64282.1 putative aldouronate transport system substrate-binding protein [Saliterribacillus persicus]
MKWKSFYMVLIFASIILILSACNSDDESSEEENADGKTNMSVFIAENGEMDLETNSFTEFAEEEFDINFEFQKTGYDSSAAKEKRQISLASGDYADVFFLVDWVDNFAPSEILKYGEQGALLPLNDLIDEHAPNLKEVLEERDEFRKIATAPDGNIYSVPGLEECFHCTWPNKLWINSDWLDELGLDVPATHEELKEVLTAFKEQDPNGNGEQDEIPLSGSAASPNHSVIPILMNGFVYDDAQTRLLVNNGEVSFAANTDEWKEGLEYIHSLYEEGLIDPGAFTQNRDAFIQLGNNADDVILGAAAAQHAWEFIDNDNHPMFDAIEPLQGPNHQYATYNYPVTNSGTFAITNKASEEAQVKAIQLLDYMFTIDGMIRSHIGVEGEDWVEPEEGDVAINEEMEANVKLLFPEDPPNNNWSAAAQYFQPREFRDGQVQAEDIYTDEGFERRLQEATYLYEGKEPEETFPFWGVWYPQDVQDEYSTLETNILDNVEQSSVQFITGELSLEDDWDDYLSGLESLGIDRYIEINQQVYDSYMNQE